jgi:hypothetical protein
VLCEREEAKEEEEERKKERKKERYITEREGSERRRDTMQNGNKKI